MKPDKLFKMIVSAVYKAAGLSGNYCVTYLDGILYVLFEESNGWIDWLFNLIFLPVRRKAYKKMPYSWRVHFGFGAMYKSIRKKLMADVAGSISALLATGHTPRVLCGGWSLGGALAQQSAEDIGFTLGVKPDIVTFGSPLPFFGDAPEVIRPRVGKVTLYKRRGDWITDLPLRRWGFKPLVPETVIGKEEYKTKIQLLRGIRAAHTGYDDPELYERGSEIENQTV
jgi:hypothetical protein